MLSLSIHYPSFHSIPFHSTGSFFPFHRYFPLIEQNHPPFTVIGIGTLPNLILRPIWSSGTAYFDNLIEYFIIPISLLLVTKWINEKFEKRLVDIKICINYWSCMFILFIWDSWIGRIGQINTSWLGRKMLIMNYMILNLELMVGLGIIGFVLLIKIITKITNRTKNLQLTTMHKYGFR